MLIDSNLKKNFDCILVFQNVNIFTFFSIDHANFLLYFLIHVLYSILAVIYFFKEGKISVNK